MTHSIDERREVAETIRAMGTEFTCFASCSDRGAVEAMREGGCSFKAAYLADLIEPLPERTCRNVGGEDGTNGEYYDFACDACGFCCDLPEPSFCPGCGAKVVEP